MQVRPPKPNSLNGNYQKVRTVLFNEVGFVVSIIGATIAVFLFLTNPAQENMREVEKLKLEVEKNREIVELINEIKTNDLHNIESQVETLDERLNDIENQLIKLETILNERLPG